MAKNKTLSDFNNSDAEEKISRRIISQAQQAELALSPWVRNALHQQPHTTDDPVQQPSMAVSTGNTLAMLNRIQRRPKQITVWQPDELSVTPMLVDRFSEDVAQRYHYTSIAIKQTLALDEARPAIQSGALPLAGHSTPSPQMDHVQQPPSQTQTTLPRLPARKKAPTDEPSPQLPSSKPHFMAKEKEDIRPSWLRNKPQPKKPSKSQSSTDIALQKMPTVGQPTKVKPDPKNLRLFSRVEYLSDMGKMTTPLSHNVTPPDSPPTEPRRADKVAGLVEPDEGDIQLKETSTADLPPPSPQPLTPVRPQPTPTAGQSVTGSTARPSAGPEPMDTAVQKSETLSSPGKGITAGWPVDKKIAPSGESIAPNLDEAQPLSPPTSTKAQPSIPPDASRSEQRLPASKDEPGQSPYTRPPTAINSLAEPRRPDQFAVGPVEPDEGDSQLKETSAADFIPTLPVRPTPVTAQPAPTTDQPVTGGITRPSAGSELIVKSSEKLEQTLLTRTAKRRQIALNQIQTEPVNRQTLLRPVVTLQQARNKLIKKGWRFKSKKADPVTNAEQVHRVVKALEQPSGTGRSLPDEPRTKVEKILGFDFSPVRVQTASLAPLNIEAATKGTDIYVESGQDRFDTPSSLALLGHELTHVKQQNLTLAKPLSQTTVLTKADDNWETDRVAGDEAEAIHTEQQILRQIDQPQDHRAVSAHGAEGQRRRWGQLEQPARRSLIFRKSEKAGEAPVINLPQPQVAAVGVPAAIADWLIATRQAEQQPLVTPAAEHHLFRQAEASAPVAATAEPGATTPASATDETASPPSDLDQLARQILPLIKRMLKVDHERRPRSSDFGFR
ncbi:MAG: DUF4157 domain-containing protein [Anaerolineales bacterium]|nr:DUF4157 domain-containing protein [Anaerolineales bacterium]